MLAEIKATAAEERNAKELHRTMFPLLSVYSCTWSNPPWSLPFCYKFNCAHFEKQHSTPVANFFQVIYIVIVRGGTSESSISFLGFFGTFHVTHRNKIVNGSGKFLSDPCPQPLLSLFSPTHWLRNSHLHTHKTNININNFRFGLNQESVTGNFLSLVEQMWDWGREEISKLEKSQIPQIFKVRSLLFVAESRPRATLTLVVPTLPCTAQGCCWSAQRSDGYDCHGTMLPGERLQVPEWTGRRGHPSFLHQVHPWRRTDLMRTAAAHPRSPVAYLPASFSRRFLQLSQVTLLLLNTHSQPVRSVLTCATLSTKTFKLIRASCQKHLQEEILYFRGFSSATRFLFKRKKSNTTVLISLDFCNI